MKRLRLGEWIFDVARGRLERDGEVRTLEPRQHDMLLRLLAAGGEVVSKDELLCDVWGGLIVVEHVVPKTVSGLRGALDESARRPRVVETVGRRGYRIACPVEEVIPPRATSAPPRLLRRRDALRMAAAAALGALLVAPLTAGPAASPEPPPERILVKHRIVLDYAIEPETGIAVATQ